MAIIKSGFLIGLYKSASGLTFYKRRGTPSVRSKPVRSLDWEPTELQRFYQIVFSTINDFVKRTPIMGALIDGGWGWSRRANSSSNLNNIIGYIFRSMTRMEGGARREIGDIAQLYTSFAVAPLIYFVERCQIVATKYPLAGLASVTPVTGNNVRFLMTDETVEVWRRKVGNMEGRFRVGSDVFILVAAGGSSISQTAQISFIVPSHNDEGYYIDIDADIINGQIWQVCLAINDDPNATPASTSGWAISPVIATSILRSDIPDAIRASISDVLLNGTTVPTTGTFQIGQGDVVTIQGNYLKSESLFLEVQRPGSSGPYVARIASVGTITSESGTQIMLTIPVTTVTEYILKIILPDGTILRQWQNPD